MWLDNEVVEPAGLDARDEWMPQCTRRVEASFAAALGRLLGGTNRYGTSSKVDPRSAGDDRPLFLRCRV